MQNEVFSFVVRKPIHGYLKEDNIDVILQMSQDVPLRLTLDYMMWEATDVSQNAALAKDGT